MLMLWCSRDAHGMMQGECGDAMPPSFSDMSKNAQYQKTTSEGLTQAINLQGLKREVSR
jgi:hypothetical protein